MRGSHEYGVSLGLRFLSLVRVRKRCTETGSRRDRWWTALVLAELVLGLPSVESASTRATEDSRKRVRPETSEAAGIRRARALLPTRLDVPIHVVELRSLSESLQRKVRNTCAFVINGAPPIYVISSCPIYKGAVSSRFEAMKLAAILQHEVAHLEGADERQARVIESRVFRELLVRHAPASDLGRGLSYTAAVEKGGTTADATGRRK